MLLQYVESSWCGIRSPGNTHAGNPRTYHGRYTQPRRVLKLTGFSMFCRAWGMRMWSSVRATHNAYTPHKYYRQWGLTTSRYESLKLLQFAWRFSICWELWVRTRAPLNNTGWVCIRTTGRVVKVLVYRWSSFYFWEFWVRSSESSSKIQDSRLTIMETGRRVELWRFSVFLYFLMLEGCGRKVFNRCELCGTCV